MGPEIKIALQTVFDYAYEATEWIVIKKELLKTLKPSDRTSFSKVHPKTRKQRTNQFELEIIAAWKEMGGNDLIFNKRNVQRKKTN